MGTEIMISKLVSSVKSQMAFLAGPVVSQSCTLGLSLLEDLVINRNLNMLLFDVTKSMDTLPAGCWVRVAFGSFLARPAAQHR